MSNAAELLLAGNRDVLVVVLEVEAIPNKHLLGLSMALVLALFLQVVSEEASRVTVELASEVALEATSEVASVATEVGLVEEVVSAIKAEVTSVVDLLPTLLAALVEEVGMVVTEMVTVEATTTEGMAMEVVGMVAEIEELLAATEILWVAVVGETDTTIATDRVAAAKMITRENAITMVISTTIRDRSEGTSHVSADYCNILTLYYCYSTSTQFMVCWWVRSYYFCASINAVPQLLYQNDKGEQGNSKNTSCGLAQIRQFGLW